MTEQNPSEWQAPPPPEIISAPETAQMSELATLGNIFIEPGRTFEDLRRKPRFILASIIIALVITGYTFGLYYKVGDAGVRQSMIEQIDKSPRAQSMSAEQKSTGVDLQMKITDVIRYAIPVFIFISLLIGGMIYWLAGKAFGGTGGFLQNLSVWVYSMLPPTAVAMIANYVVLALKSVDEIDYAASQRGVIQASPAFLFDGKTMPVLATLIGTIDLFFIWGWILAAIGLRITNKISSTSAWSIVLILALIGVAFRVVGAMFSGNPG